MKYEMEIIHLFSPSCYLHMFLLQAVLVFFFHRKNHLKKMNNFTTLLHSLSVDEVKGFDKYLKRIFKEDSIPFKISKYYLSVHKKKQSFPSLDIAFKKIFKITAKDKAAKAKLQNGLSDLFLELKEYLILEKFKARTFERDMIWMEVLDEKNLNHQRDLYKKKILSKLEADEPKNVWHALEELRFYHFIFFRNNFQKDNPKIDLLQKGMEALEEFSQSMKMKLHAEMMNRKNLMPDQELSPELKSILLDLDENKIQIENPSKNSELYFLLFKFFQKNNTREYQRVKRYLIKNNQLLHQDEKLTILIYLINFLNGKIKKDRAAIMKEAFEIYQFGLDEKFLIYKNKLSATQFTNIITIACYLNEFDWAEDFIQKYKLFLSESIREEKTMNGLMIVNFKRKNFTQVLSLYQQISFTNILFIISGRIHHLASLYELEYFDTLDDKLEAFISFLRKNKKVGKDNRDAALSFAKVLKNLYKRNLKRERVKKEFEAYSKIYFQSWLRSKIDEYNQRE